MGLLVWVGLWVKLISHSKTTDAIPYSYSNPAEYFCQTYFEHFITRTAFNIIVLVRLWIAGEGPKYRVVTSCTEDGA